LANQPCRAASTNPFLLAEIVAVRCSNDRRRGNLKKIAQAVIRKSNLPSEKILDLLKPSIIEPADDVAIDDISAHRVVDADELSLRVLIKGHEVVISIPDLQEFAVRIEALTGAPAIAEDKRSVRVSSELCVEVWRGYKFALVVLTVPVIAIETVTVGMKKS